jgi:hypothetical protein
VPKEITNNMPSSRSIAEKLGLECTPKTPLCHYTSQLGLIGILKEKAMWATDAAYQNDSQEVVYAFNLAQKYFGTMDMSATLLETKRIAGQLPVYVASFPEEPDLLSQWRGYCSQGSGFAMCLDADHMIRVADTHGWGFFKCIYDEAAQIELLKRMEEQAVLHKDTLFQYTTPPKGLPVRVQFGLLLLFYATVFKHPKFKEESEWRAIKRAASSSGTPANPPGVPVIAPHIRPGASTLIPYTLFPLTLNENDSIQLAELVVGPTPHPILATRAVEILLKEKKVFCPKVRSSEIPFRNW